MGGQAGTFPWQTACTAYIIPRQQEARGSRHALIFISSCITCSTWSATAGQLSGSVSQQQQLCMRSEYVHQFTSDSAWTLNSRQVGHAMLLFVGRSKLVVAMFSNQAHWHLLRWITCSLKLPGLCSWVNSAKTWPASSLLLFSLLISFWSSLLFSLLAPATTVIVHQTSNLAQTKAAGHVLHSAIEQYTLHYTCTTDQFQDEK